jgi:hypothetical protein
MDAHDLPNSLVMVRPSSFGFNPQTSATNPFQKGADFEKSGIQQKVISEFDRMVALLNSYGIVTHVFEDSREHEKPDAIFPNNWISFHPGGEVILYPMMAPNRRRERRRDIIDALRSNFEVNAVIDLTEAENNGMYLEGTGSLVFDHAFRRMYACHSPRTNEELAQRVASELGYQPIMFHAVDDQNIPIYHTNVMLGIGRRFVVVCLDAVKSETDQDAILDSFANTSRQVVAISLAQMKAFAGNVIEVESESGDPVILMSEQAFNSFLPGQLQAIGRFAEVLAIQIPTIEKYGGGGVRCMVAGVHLPKRK